MSEVRRVPIFPLPETVFFPSVALPLHLFEPRYLQMAQDVLSSDKLLVIVLLRPGWQADYYGTPPVHEIATLGSVEAHERLPDGRFNVTLQGLERVRLLPTEGGERSAGRLYRVREVSPAPELRPPDGVATAELAARLRSLWRELEEKSGKATVGALSGERLGFDTLVNRISSLADLPADVKQMLLEQDDLLLRAAALEGHVEQALRFWRTLAAFRRLAPDDPSVN
jgi:Lon protease-like protein